MPFLCRNGRCRNTIGSFTCDCVDGYTMTSDEMNCRDVDECTEVKNTNLIFFFFPQRRIPYNFFSVFQHPNPCQHPGKCQNLMGSYTCLCPTGYKSINNNTACADIDECVENEGTCEDGTCINTDGSFRCDCPDGFIVSSNGMKCIDMRKDFCYDQFYRGE